VTKVDDEKSPNDTDADADADALLHALDALVVVVKPKVEPTAMANTTNSHNSRDSN
jgi:hypothetical protein